MTGRLRFDLTATRVRNATGTGVVAYAAGFLASFLAGRVRIGESLDQGTSAGIVFYNSHLVDLISTRPTGGSGGTSRDPINLVTGRALSEFYASPTEGLHQSPIPDAAWLLLPVVVLISAGVLVNVASDSESVTAETAVLTGSLTTLGYFPLVVAGALLIGHRGEVYVYLLDLATATGVAGAMYPLVLGGLGGYFYHKLL